jgi:hypothetical protein
MSIISVIFREILNVCDAHDNGDVHDVCDLIDDCEIYDHSRMSGIPMRFLIWHHQSMVHIVFIKALMSVIFMYGFRTLMTVMITMYVLSVKFLRNMTHMMSLYPCSM